MGQDLDVAFKTLIRQSPQSRLVKLLFGREVDDWLNVEQPRVTNYRSDLFAQGPRGGFRHVELQSENDADVGRRMAEYYLWFLRERKAEIDQIVLYIGASRCTMEPVFKTKKMRHRFRILEASRLDAKRLASSPHWVDNAVALLASNCDRDAVLDTLRTRVDRLPVYERGEAVATVLIISGILGLEGQVQARFRVTMSTLMDNKVIGPMVREYLAQQESTWRAEAEQKGRASVLTVVLEERFGPLPDWAVDRIRNAREQELTTWARLVLSAPSLEQVLEP